MGPSSPRHAPAYSHDSYPSPLETSVTSAAELAPQASSSQGRSRPSTSDNTHGTGTWGTFSGHSMTGQSAMEQVGINRHNTRVSEVHSTRSAFRPQITLNPYTFLICCIVAFGGLLFGYDTGNMAGVMQMPYFIKTFGHEVPVDSTMSKYGATAIIDGHKYAVSPVYKSLITSFLSIGTFLGALAGAYLADNWGRKGSLIISGFVFLAGVIIQTVCDTVEGLIVGRLIAGLGVGTISMSTPLYISEVAPPRLRGSLVSVYQLCITCGICLAQGIDWATSRLLNSASWRVPIGLQCLWACILLAGCAYVAESPRYLVRRGFSSEALQSLARMRAKGETTIAVREEYSEILNNWEWELAYGEASYKECFRGNNLRRTMLGLCVQMFQQFTGINFLFYYGTTFFENAGVPNPFAISLLTGAVNIFFTLPGIWAVERIGRRSLLMNGAAWMCACELLIAIVSTVSHSHKAINAVLTVFECLFIAGFASTWGPGAWVLTGEVFPLKLRGKGMSLSASSNWLWNWALTFTAPYMADHGYGALGSKIAFVWAGTCFGALVWSYLFVPETRYLSLEELDEMFEARLPAWKTRDFVPTGVSVQDPNLIRRRSSLGSRASWQRDASPSRSQKSGGSGSNTHSLHNFPSGQENRSPSHEVVYFNRGEIP